jgi:hypothetical protein
MWWERKSPYRKSSWTHWTYFPVRLCTQGVTYPHSCFGQSMHVPFVLSVCLCLKWLPMYISPATLNSHTDWPKASCSRNFVGNLANPMDLNGTCRFLARKLLIKSNLFESPVSLAASTGNLSRQLLAPVEFVTFHTFCSYVSMLLCSRNDNQTCVISCTCKLSFRVSVCALCLPGDNTRERCCFRYNFL